MQVAESVNQYPSVKNCVHTMQSLQSHNKDSEHFGTITARTVHTVARAVDVEGTNTSEGQTFVW